MTKSEIDEIMKLVSKGFKLELIAFELDIAVDELKMLIQNQKRRSKNRKKVEVVKEEKKEEILESVVQEEIAEPDYEKIIEGYKEQIIKNSGKSLDIKNLLAFAYFKAGRIEEARDELFSLVDEYNSHTAYRQLVHLEKSQGNLRDAKDWAYEGIANFPDSISLRENLISIAREEKDRKEEIRLMKEIISINPENFKIKDRLDQINGQER